MAFCVNCGKELNPVSAFCTYCGAPVSQEASGKTEDALNALNSYSASQSNDGFAQVENHGASAGLGLSYASFKVDGDVSNPAASQGMTKEAGQRSGIVPPNTLLANWEIDRGMLVLGILTFPSVNIVLTKIFEGRSVPVVVYVVYLLISLVFIAFQIAYSIKVYPSYYSTKPLVEDRKLVSYLNGLGGIIFGILWSKNMEKNKKGISYIVAAIVFSIEFISIVNSLVLFFIS